MLIRVCQVIPTSLSVRVLAHMTYLLTNDVSLHLLIHSHPRHSVQVNEQQDDGASIGFSKVFNYLVAALPIIMTGRQSTIILSLSFYRIFCNDERICFDANSMPCNTMRYRSLHSPQGHNASLP